MNGNPPFSIVVPVRNGAETLGRTLDSLLSQQGVTLDILVLDGGSVDGTPALLERYAPHLYYWRSHPDGGQAQALNEGFAHARPGIWAWLNADDTYTHPRVLSWVAERFAENRGTEWLYASSLFTTPTPGLPPRPYRARPLPEGWRALAYWHGWPVPQPSTFFSSELWQRAGGVREDLHHAMDYDLFSRMNRLSPPRVYPREFLSTYLRHPGSKTGPLGQWSTHRKRFYRECRRVNRSLAPWWAQPLLFLSWLRSHLKAGKKDRAPQTPAR